MDLINEASELYDKADEQQQTIVELLADADEAYAAAEKAVKKGNDTWAQAQNTYKVLSTFDNEVNQHKQAATEALNEVDAIRALTYEQQQKTQQTQDTLDQAYNTAVNANNTAGDAKTKYAEQASANLKEVIKESGNLQQMAGKLRLEANDFAERVTDTGNNLKKLEDQATNDRDLITEVKKKVGQAGKYSLEASNQVQKAMVDVQDIINILEHLPAITSEDLDKLEAKLQKAENELLEADLDRRLQDIRNQKQTQTILIDNYENSVKKLKEEVDIIRDISESLPNHCFKRTKLEP